MIAWLRLGIIKGFVALRNTSSFADKPCCCFISLSMSPRQALDLAQRHGEMTAHLGGFIYGAILAIVLLLTRQVNMRGTDMISVLLGRHAWKLLGTPAENADAS